MKKVDEYNRLKEAIGEIEFISLVHVKDEGVEIPLKGTVPENKYTIEFSSSYRGLLLTEDLVKKALTENLGRIQGSMQHWARQWIDDKHVEAVHEVDAVLLSLIGQKTFEELENLGQIGGDMEGHEVTLRLNEILHPELYGKDF